MISTADLRHAQNFDYEPREPRYNANRNKRHDNVGWQRNQNIAQTVTNVRTLTMTTDRAEPPPTHEL